MDVMGGERVPEGLERVVQQVYSGKEWETGVGMAIYLREWLLSLRWLIPKVAQPHRGYATI